MVYLNKGDKHRYSFIRKPGHVTRPIIDSFFKGAIYAP
jgi:hypothetical protein